VECFNLDVFPPSLAVDVPVLDPRVGELNVAVTLGEIMLASPKVSLFDGSIRTPITVAAPPISFLEESLIVTLELGVQDNTFDAGAKLPEPFRCQ
jgi:hypothetical protein